MKKWLIWSFGGLAAMLVVVMVVAAGLYEKRVAASLAQGDTSVSATASVEDGLFMPDPAALYCTKIMGYKYQVTVSKDGSQKGECVLPDHTVCDAWAFYGGTCGTAYNFCARQGYHTETRADGRDPYLREYAECVTAEGLDAGAVGNVSGLYDLVKKITPLRPAEEIRSLGNDQEKPRLSTVAALPPSIDWRNHNGNWLSPIRDQGSCGSCWAFAAIGATESYWDLTANNPNLNLDLSEQELISCSDAGDCGGGYSDEAMTYIHQSGVVDEACEPYTESNSACSRCSDWEQRRHSVAWTLTFYGPSPLDIKHEVAMHGPMVVYMGIGNEVGGHFDNQGIYRCDNDDDTNHAVVVVGYNDNGGYWIVRNSWGTGWGDNGYFKVGYGECAIDTTMAILPFNLQVPRLAADFNGDGKKDPVAFLFVVGQWWSTQLSYVYYGRDGDEIIPADFNGDRKAEVAVFRPSTGDWWIKGRGHIHYGREGDIPLPVDLNGDRKADILIFRPSTGDWWIKGWGRVHYGQSGDIPVPADYDGDHRAELAVFRPSTGDWWIRGMGRIHYGQNGDVPVPADYNGDGRAEIAIYRPSTGYWWVRGLGKTHYGGAPGDIPVPGDYNGDRRAEVAIFRPVTETWWIRGVGHVTYGDNSRPVVTQQEVVPDLPWIPEDSPTP